jgi:hypothetical protein
MSDWYNRVSANIEELDNCIAHFETELQNGRKELSLKAGKSIEQHGSELPGIVEYRYLQLQEIEAILEFLNIQLKQIKSQAFKKYLENYPRQLSSADCVKYSDGDPDVVDMAYIVNRFALLRNKFLGLYKGLEQKDWMLSHIVKLRAAGLEDINV